MLIIFLIFSACCACDNRRKVEKTYEDFVGATVSFPSEMLCVEGKTKSVRPVGGDHVKFVYYIDSTECSSCSIAHLSAFNKLVDLSEGSDKFDFIIIFSPRVNNAANLADDLVAHEYDFPIFIDSKGEFRRLNPGIPPGKLFHQFLLGPSGHPAFVGSPIMSQRMASLFRKTLAELDIKTDNIFN